MKTLNRTEAVDRMNRLAGDNRAYVFVVSYDGEKAYVEPLEDVDLEEMLYCFGAESNVAVGAPATPYDAQWTFERPDTERYRQSFDLVKSNIRTGNSYLANLTCRVRLSTNLTLRDLFLRSEARYRLWISDRLVCFSPETFVTIDGDTICSFPMKGTADASSSHAEQRLMADVKESAEHATIVDLIRNDLGMVASDVSVPRYRYVERLETNRGALLQTSSEIRGRLLPYYRDHPGDLLMRLLPAGSITGAPKARTMDIIARAEQYDRGFYTGVTGIWKDGRMDSGVMIRFIDKEDGQLYYKAGGGITAMSEETKEYEEIISKIYVPIR